MQTQTIYDMWKWRLVIDILKFDCQRRKLACKTHRFLPSSPGQKTSGNLSPNICCLLDICFPLESYNHLTKRSRSFLYYLLWWPRFRVIACVMLSDNPSICRWCFHTVSLASLSGSPSCGGGGSHQYHTLTLFGNTLVATSRATQSQPIAKSKRLPYLSQPSFPQTRVMVLTTPTSLLVLLLGLTNVLTNTEVSILLLHQPHIMNKISRAAH